MTRFWSQKVRFPEIREITPFWSGDLRSFGPELVHFCVTFVSGRVSKTPFCVKRVYWISLQSSVYPFGLLPLFASPEIRPQKRSSWGGPHDWPFLVTFGPKMSHFGPFPGSWVGGQIWCWQYLEVPKSWRVQYFGGSDFRPTIWRSVSDLAIWKVSILGSFQVLKKPWESQKGVKTSITHFWPKTAKRARRCTIIFQYSCFHPFCPFWPFLTTSWSRLHGNVILAYSGIFCVTVLSLFCLCFGPFQTPILP